MKRKGNKEKSIIKEENNIKEEYKIKEKNDVKEKSNIRYIIAIMSILIILIGLLLAYICKGYFDIMIENQEKQLLVISQNVATALETSIQRSEDDIDYLVNSLAYIEGETEYFETGNYDKLYTVMQSYTDTHSWEVNNMIICKDTIDNPLLFVKDIQYEKVLDVSIETDKEIALWKNSNNQMFMAIATKDKSNYKLVIMIDLEHLYDELVSYIKLGAKGYVMVKDADATIIMHKLVNQIGINAIEDRQNLFPSLNINNTSLENMINNQKAKQEGAEIYESYWWADENPKLVKKITAYTHADIEKGFLIVSAVMDYSAVAKLIINDVMSIVLLSIVVVIEVSGLMLYIILSIRRRNKIATENEYLRELNKSLQTLHENELVMAHQQQLQIIGTMTGGIAHEFNNLLTPIMGYAGLMISGMEEDNEYYEDISEIYDASEKAKEIVHQISGLSRQNMDTVFKFVDVNQLLTRVSKMAESVKPDNIEVLTQMQSSEYGIFGNATQINQVMLNLIMNAYQAMGSVGGQVILKYEEINMQQLKTLNYKEIDNIENYNDRFAKIVVEDNGCGINQNVIIRIFDPFFTTKGSDGIGLGLAIANNIVTSHKGMIFAESQVGIGTKFIIVLPLTEKASQKIVTPKLISNGVTEQNIKVLVVDDSPKVLRLLEKGLKSFGYQVRAINNPHTALEEMKSDTFDIVISDDSMREMNGIQLAMNVKQKNPQMPIIIVTGMLRKEIIDSKQSQVIEEYMVKPIAIDAIAEVINNILKKS
ncbi:MAG: response regulator [Lachnotalea sp.]